MNELIQRVNFSVLWLEFAPQVESPWTTELQYNYSRNAIQLSRHPCIAGVQIVSTGANSAG
uniref:Uncharacterized protein n=1 Tax=Anguilla anguilla TaxID=7936 RepID=A0A0E9VQ64_ANGAN